MLRWLRRRFLRRTAVGGMVCRMERNGLSHPRRGYGVDRPSWCSCVLAAARHGLPRRGGVNNFDVTKVEKNRKLDDSDLVNTDELRTTSLIV